MISAAVNAAIAVAIAIAIIIYGHFSDVNSQNFNLRVSNPRTIAYLDLETPFHSSSPKGPGAIFPRLNI